MDVAPPLASAERGGVMSRASVAAVIRKLFTALSGAQRETRTQPVNTAAPPTGPTDAPLQIRSCAASETIVVRTCSSVYELIVLRGESGEMLVRGGKYFSSFCNVVFVGSVRDDCAPQRHTIDVGLRMQFWFDDRIIVTSAVQSVARRLMSVDPAHCAASQKAGMTVVGSGTSHHTDEGAGHDEGRRCAGDADQQLDAGDRNIARAESCSRSG
jgi:hypothetical protein